MNRYLFFTIIFKNGVQLSFLGFLGESFLPEVEAGGVCENLRCLVVIRGYPCLRICFAIKIAKFLFRLFIIITFVVGPP